MISTKKCVDTREYILIWVYAILDKMTMDVGEREGSWSKATAVGQRKLGSQVRRQVRDDKGHVQSNMSMAGVMWWMSEE